MKLATYYKEAFVRSVMNDVPKIDYQKRFLEVINLDMLKIAPPKIAELLKDPELRCYLVGNNSYYSTNNGYGAGLSSVCCYPGYTPSPEAGKAIDKIVSDAYTQKKDHTTLELKLKQSISICSTLKIAKERMPDLAKYLPEEVEKGALLPAVIDLTADLTKAGWPAKKVAVTA